MGAAGPAPGRGRVHLRRAGAARPGRRASATWDRRRPSAMPPGARPGAARASSAPACSSDRRPSRRSARHAGGCPYAVVVARAVRRRAACVFLWAYAVGGRPQPHRRRRASRGLFFLAGAAPAPGRSGGCSAAAGRRGRRRGRRGVDPTVHRRWPSASSPRCTASGSDGPVGRPLRHVPDRDRPARSAAGTRDRPQCGARPIDKRGGPWLTRRRSTSTISCTAAALCSTSLLDFEAYPEWASDLKEATVVDRDDEGRAVGRTLPGRRHGPQHHLPAPLRLRRRARTAWPGRCSGRHHAQARRQLRLPRRRRRRRDAPTSPTSSPSTSSCRSRAS